MLEKVIQAGPGSIGPEGILASRDVEAEGFQVQGMPRKFNMASSQNKK